MDNDQGPQRRGTPGLPARLVVVGLVVLAAAACTRGDEAPAAAPAKPARPATAAGAADTTTTSAEATGEGDDAVVAADPSDGCHTGSGGGSASAVTPGDDQVTLDVDGDRRTYLRHVPPSYDGVIPMPVVVDIHGYANAAHLESMISGMGVAGDTDGFVTLTPQAQGDPAHWDTRIDGTDVPFFGRVLDDAEAGLCVDRNRVFATGYSYGGFMASTLACALSDRIAAVAPVAGLRDVPGCAPSRAVPVVAFQGTEDTFLRYDGGIGPGVEVLPAPDGSGRTVDAGTLTADGSLIPGSTDESVPDIAQAWADRNGCTAGPDESDVADDVALVEYGCPAGADVQLYRIDGGGTTWPGSDVTQTFKDVTGSTTFSIDATDLIWDFFTAHPRG
jgi:polyhydroxybutyrate depolymerase